jgi:hypothetical protein
MLQHGLLTFGRFHRGGIIQGVLLYTLTPWKTPRKSMGEWDYRTRIIPLLSSMKPGLVSCHPEKQHLYQHLVLDRIQFSTGK